MKSSWLKLLPLLLAPLLLAGCTHTDAPALSSVTMTLTGVKTEGGQTVATVRYFNESVISIGLAGARHRIYLNGSYVGQAVYEQPLGLASGGMATLDLPLSGGDAPARGGAAAYRMENVVHVLVGDRKLEARSQSTGTVGGP